LHGAKWLVISYFKAEKGMTYKPDCFMMLLFDKLSGYNNEMFCYEFIAACSAYNKGEDDP
jgi:hypothetical protein